MHKGRDGRKAEVDRNKVADHSRVANAMHDRTADHSKVVDHNAAINVRNVVVKAGQCTEKAGRCAEKADPCAEKAGQCAERVVLGRRKKRADRIRATDVRSSRVATDRRNVVRDRKVVADHNKGADLPLAKAVHNEVEGRKAAGADRRRVDDRSATTHATDALSHEMRHRNDRPLTMIHGSR